MNKKNIIYKAGVLLIAAVMVLSVLPAVTAETEEKPIDLKKQFTSAQEYWEATEEAPSKTAENLRKDLNEPIETDTIITAMFWDIRQVRTRM